jgi:hypothetical protein
MSLVDFLLAPDVRTLGLKSDSKTSVLPTETVDGVEYRVVLVQNDGPMPYSNRIALGPDGLVHHVMQRSESVLSSFGPSGQTQEVVHATREMVVSHLDVETVHADTEFLFRPPADARLEDLSRFEESMLAPGKAAPDFTLPSLSGEQLSLSQMIRESKAVLITFWFYG